MVLGNLSSTRKVQMPFAIQTVSHVPGLAAAVNHTWLHHQTYQQSGNSPVANTVKLAVKASLQKSGWPRHIGQILGMIFHS